MKWDHHGCSLRDWIRSPEPAMSRLPSRPREAAVNETADTCPTSSRITAPSSYLLCALHPGGPRWCCSGHSEIFPAATHSPPPAHPMMPWWKEDGDTRLKGAISVSQGHRHQEVVRIKCGRSAAAAAPGPRKAAALGKSITRAASWRLQVLLAKSATLTGS